MRLNKLPYGSISRRLRAAYRVVDCATGMTRQCMGSARIRSNDVSICILSYSTSHRSPPITTCTRRGSWLLVIGCCPTRARNAAWTATATTTTTTTNPGIPGRGAQGEQRGHFGWSRCRDFCERVLLVATYRGLETLKYAIVLVYFKTNGGVFSCWRVQGTAYWSMASNCAACCVAGE